MGWFCQGFGFGEITQGYDLSRQYAVPVESIFNLRRSGLGWGQIRQQLAAGALTSGGSSPEHPGQGKPPKPTKVKKK
jgi:hypothetical protein